MGFKVFFQEKSGNHKLANISEKQAEGRRKKLFGKRKKNRKKKTMVKNLAVIFVLLTKFNIILKIFHSHLQMKFLGIAVMGLIMQFTKFWLDVKTGYSPPRTLHHESAIKPIHLFGEDIPWSRKD